jgi:hypothetical protein
MSEWPDGVTLGAIREWPGQLRAHSQREHSRFKTSGYEGGYRRKSTPLSSTLELLDRELTQLRATDRTLLVAIAPQDFRLDGKPRAQAKAEHPGVILSFRTKLGQLSYPCDTFTTWQDNLRAIALALEALRKIDRYGVTTNGEQYRGFLALESSMTALGSIGNSQQALRILFDAAEMIVEDGVTYEPDALRRIVRKALFRTHPDTSSAAPADHERVKAAEAYLRTEGRL